MTDDRNVVLDGAWNVRDLGGLKTEFGHTVRRGRLFRAGSLSRLSETGRRALTDLDLRTVVDFRTPSEIVSEGADVLPDSIEWTHLPTGGGSIQELYALVSSGRGGGTEFTEAAATAAMENMARAFVTDESQRDQFAIAVRAVADPRRLPLLFHCTAGKDRTGWLAATVLRILGVPPDDVVADYLLSNTYFAGGARRFTEAMIAAGIDTAPVEPLLHQRPSYLMAAFDEADSVFGSFEGFVADGLGLDDGTADRLRETLLE